MLGFATAIAALCAVSEGKLRMRRRAVAALCAHKQEGLQQLKSDPDEMLRGMGLSPSAALPCSCCFMQYAAAILRNILPLFAVGQHHAVPTTLHICLLWVQLQQLCNSCTHLQVVQPQQSQH